MFRKILIANRGEIALRVIRAAREMGIESVAIHSTADAEAMHVRLADQHVCVGPPPAAQSYLNQPAILAACEITGAEAVHPGYGFLAENAGFARKVEESRLAFIGPGSEHIALMGDKIAAKETMGRLGVPCVPGSPGAVGGIAEARGIAEELGYPLLVKAAAGGGGRGMKVARKPDQLAGAMASARAEAKAAFGDDAIYLEKYLARPRHIEVQVIGDMHGNACHLGERDCSLQRRHQKVFEEAPSPVIDAETRERIGKTCADAVRDMGYRGVGTIEFLYEDGEFHFIEMNTRLQVEHPVTEAVYGVDLVQEQIRIAAGEKLSFAQDDLIAQGHAVECRINAERMPRFMPSPGLVDSYHAPGGLGVRIDSHLFAGYRVPTHYDSLVAKLIVHGADRPSCLMRLRRALAETIVGGIDTTLPLFHRLLESPEFLSGDYDIHWLEEWLAEKPE